MKTIIIILLLALSLFSRSIDITESSQNIMQESQYYFALEGETFEDVKNHEKFQNILEPYLNFGVKCDETLWVKFVLKNPSTHTVQRFLEIVDLYPHSIRLFNEEGALIKSSLLREDETLTTLNLTYSLILPPSGEYAYYMRVKNDKTMLRFAMRLRSAGDYLDSSVGDIMEIVFLFGVIAALMLYNLLIYFYLKESMYLFYVLYIGAVVLQQLSYVSLLPILFTQEIIDIAHATSLVQISLMYLSASLYSQSFLQTKNYPRINAIYKLFIALAIIEIPLVGTSFFYLPEVGLLTGLLFVFFNTFSGIYIYLDGNKQARLFSLAWIMLMFAYTIIILDSLSLISVMQKMPNLILYFTALEALILSLAFSDRYRILRAEKEESDHLLLDTLEEQTVLIGEEVRIKTEDLHNALENEKTLLKELHHRTKNNLQLILSLIRMQASRADNDEIREEFFHLEGRISAISRTHEILYLKDNLESVNMQEYIGALCAQMQEGVAEVLEFDLSIKDVVMPLRESVYIGLIINELVTNTIKYAHPIGNKKIIIKMQKSEGEYLLLIGDNGEGCSKELLEGNSLGLTLVRTLVENQLEGSLEISINMGLFYTIKFRL